uniref:Leucine rich repeat containing 7 n=1 Tax=Salmo trutta TaxID=8032 RepID=A0A674D6J6_SALTR
MTTKRKIIGRLVPCRLQQVPKEIFSFERTLEELYLDANQIEELPKQLFNCQALRKLSMPDNDLSNLPTTIASLVNLRELDISKNGIQEFPDNIKCCKCLSVVEASVNPIAKLPDGFTQLLNLTQLFLNDAFLEYLPYPALRLWVLGSIHRLSQLERLDLGSNEFTELPEVLEQIHNLKELWMDNNSLQKIPGCIGKLRQLRYLDLAKNRIESLDTDISGCECLEDLLLSSNMLQHLPDTIGMLKKLTTLKVDDNQLTSLPNTIGSLSLLEEFDCSCNELESLPPTIGYLPNLRTFSADENFLIELPREIGNCKNVTVMSLRSNKLEFLPDEIGQMTKLRVLNLSDNRISPFTFTKLKDLAALWLSDNQSKALIPLQTEAHPETKQRVLTNYMFPQQPRHDEDYQSDSDSFNPTLWEEQRQQRMTVAFEFEEKKEEEDNSGKVEINLKRYPTPYPEDLKNMVKSVQNMVGKNQLPLSTGTNSSGTNMEPRKQEQYEPPWPMPPKEVTDRVTPHTQKPTHTTTLSLSHTHTQIQKQMIILYIVLFG